LGGGYGNAQKPRSSGKRHQIAWLHGMISLVQLAGRGYRHGMHKPLRWFKGVDV
jgi:hypothetical protein